MKISTVRAVISILIVACFLGVTSVIALTPVVGKYPPSDYTEHLKTWASLYSGLVGLILGYYFGKRGEKDT
jgi:hypothetical protein